MSGQPGNNGDLEPQHKRQKRSDEKEAAKIIALGGPMYDEATARKMLQEVVIVDADWPGNETRDGQVIVFDTALDKFYRFKDDHFEGRLTLLTYFASKGDVKMCRYLISRGASTTTKTFPMYAAAGRGHLDICKILCANGWRNDIWKEDLSGWTPFHIAAYKGHDELVRWFVLQGALCADANSEEIKKEHIYPEIMSSTENAIFVSSYERLVEWAKEVTESHSSLMMFLLGTLPPAPDEDQSRTIQCLSGHPGVRKLVGDFVGQEVTKAKHLRILRNVVDVVPFHEGPYWNDNNWNIESMYDGEYSSDDGEVESPSPATAATGKSSPPPPALSARPI